MRELTKPETVQPTALSTAHQQLRRAREKQVHAKTNCSQKSQATRSALSMQSMVRVCGVWCGVLCVLCVVVWCGVWWCVLRRAECLEDASAE